jgi:hypothetical protein
MAIEMESPSQNPGRPDAEVEEYKYKDVQWKDFITKPKYIRAWHPIICRGSRTDFTSLVDFIDRYYCASYTVLRTS